MYINDNIFLPLSLSLSLTLYPLSASTSLALSLSLIRNDRTETENTQITIAHSFRQFTQNVWHSEKLVHNFMQKYFPNKFSNENFNVLIVSN